MTWQDMTWHATVAHPTSTHNQPHYFIAPRKQLRDIKTGPITTMQLQRNGLGIAQVGRLAHIL